MSEGHREAVAWLFRDARGRDESNATNYARPVTLDVAPVTYAICSFVRPQQNCEKRFALSLLCRRGQQKHRREAAGLDQIGSSRHG